MSNITERSNSTLTGNFTNEENTGFKWLGTLQYTMFGVIFVSSVIGNTLVCLVIILTPRMRTTRNFLLVNLAIADLTVALLCIPFEVFVKLTYPRWLLGPVMCKILWPIMTSVTTCSSATLVAISYDRYRAVVHPWKPRFTSNQTALIVAITWSVSFVTVIPFLLVLTVKDEYCREVWPSDTARRSYTLGLFIVQFMIPILIIAYAYSKVVLKLRHQAYRFAKRAEVSEALTTLTVPSSSFLTPELSDMASLSGSPLPEKKSDMAGNQIRLTLPRSTPTPGRRKAIWRVERSTKIVKMLVTVVLLYAFCMLPNQVVWLWIEFGSGDESPHLTTFLTLGSSMIYLNSSVNPILYAGMNDEFRSGFLNILLCRCRRPFKKY